MTFINGIAAGLDVQIRRICKGLKSTADGLTLQAMAVNADNIAVLSAQHCSRLLNLVSKLSKWAKLPMPVKVLNTVTPTQVANPLVESTANPTLQLEA